MPSTDLFVGLGGASRNACATLSTRERILGICEQERITRVRAAGFNSTGFPDEALDELLRRSGRRRSEVTAYAVAETSSARTATELVHLDHHFAHACAAFLPSPFESATIVVCDHEPPQVSVWEGAGLAITPLQCPWNGPGFAEIYSRCAEALGFASEGGEQRLEALARLEPAGLDDRAAQLFKLDGDRLEVAPDWQTRIQGWVGTAAPREKAAGLAASLQSRIADLVVAFLGEVSRRTPTRRRLCVGGSLFFNSHINTRVKACGDFDEVFIPINPGNAGLAVGTALQASGHRQPVTPFLGPSYSSEEIKATLDNCKLSYEWASEADSIGIAVEALQKGGLVAWFDGPMEWGPRALGGRSILASPFAPYVLDNLNRFLKQRDPWRGYALSGPDAAVRQHFDGPLASPFMECQYVPTDRQRFRHILPGPNAAVRVQTVGSDGPRRFRALLEAFGQAAGLPIVVNTSFNGFREPIVCSPRDAVRVFFGTGLDALVFDHFVIRK